MLGLHKRLCIAEHASSALYKLFLIYNKTELPTSEKCNLFNALVAPVLNYSSEVWDFHEGNNIELVHTKFCRKVLYVARTKENVYYRFVSVSV